jgi:hypothetical protein
MSSNFEVIHKILKNEENRKMLFLLNEKEALTYDELMEAFHLGTYLLNYHLKVLDDFLTKTDDAKYVLSEKGKQAYALLNDLPKSAGLSRRWKIEWYITVAICVVIAVSAWYVFDFQITILVRGLGAALFFAALIYYLKVKPMTTARLLYIGCGVSVLGVVLWLLSWGFANAIKLQSRSAIGFDLFFIISLFVCCIIGGFVGELIGKKLQYRWPPFGPLL